MERRGDKLLLRFDNLSPSDDWSGADSFVGYGPEGELRLGGFEVAGTDRVFHPAEGRVLWGDGRIEVSSPEVAEPVAVRYAFRNWCPEANVFTTSGQPLAPFRSDDWPLDDIGEIR